MDNQPESNQGNQGGEKVDISLEERQEERGRKGEVNQSEMEEKVSQVSQLAVQQKHLKLKIITWNLMGSLPPQQSVNKLINKQNLKGIDLLVIATQECERTLLASFFNDSKQSWEHMLFESLHQLNFVRIIGNTLQGLHLIIFSLDTHFKSIKHIESRILKCGFYGFTGNKGASIIQFEIYNHSITFANIHLAAGHNEVEERNMSLQQIRESIAPNHKEDTCFIFGDFNYRIDISQEQGAKLNSSPFDSLHQYISQDQMLSQKQLTSFFDEYKQGVVNFPPTYKMGLNSNVYVQNRIPGWTDRIYYRHSPNIHLEEYYCEHNIFGSDHRPVIGLFDLSVNISQSKKKPKRKSKKKAVASESQQDQCLIF